jgi:xanthine dehydrogenase accessory factor
MAVGARASMHTTSSDTFARMTDPAPGIPRTALPFEVLRAVLDALDRGRRVALASVIARHGSAPSTPGQKLALFDDMTAVGTIGGGAVERVVLAAMVKALSGPPPPPRIETFRLGASLGMCCGGSVDILVEALVPAASALVIGAGHVGVFVAPLLASLGFRVVLCDARDAAMDPARLARLALPAEGARDDSPGGLASGGLSSDDGSARGGVRVVHAEHDDPEVARWFPSPAEAIALVATHDHKLDQAAIEWALDRGFGFVGGVGSRAKAARTRARLEAKGAKIEDIERVRMPVGIDVAARTPAEIGVAIAAELIAWRAGQQRSRWQTTEPARAEEANDARAPESEPSTNGAAIQPRDTQAEPSAPAATGQHGL